MKKYRIDTMFWSSEVTDDFQNALKMYESTKESVMDEGVNKDTYVELVCSEDDFHDYKVLKRAMPVEDKELTKEIGTPFVNGFEFIWWAKWEELIDDRTINKQ